MKKRWLSLSKWQNAIFAFLLLLTFDLSAQNKSLGVGTTTPNPNAALHVESPTSNQGMIIPRLTTAQRTSLTTLLDADEEGLMLFDTDENTLYLWDGIAWKTNDGSGELTLPVDATVNTSTSSFMIQSTSTDATEPVMSISSAASAAAIVGFNVKDTASAMSGAHGVMGIARSGNNNAGVYGTNLGNGTAVMGETSTGWSAMFGYQHNVFGWGANFEIDNPANSWPTLHSHTSGSGSAALLSINNTANSAPAVTATTVGTGSAGRFVIDNTAADTAALYATTNGVFSGKSAAIVGETATAYTGVLGKVTGGVGNAIVAHSTSPEAGSWGLLARSQNGAAGVFRSNASSEPAVLIDADGIGGGVTVTAGLNSTNAAADIFSRNVNNTSHALQVQTDGLGHAGLFIVNNSASLSPAVYASTIGDSPAGSFHMENSSSFAPALEAYSSGVGPVAQFGTSTAWTAIAASNDNPSGGNVINAENNAAGNGIAGRFLNSLASNGYPAIQASTEGIGTGVRVIQSSTAIGGGMDVIMQNTANTASGFWLHHQGMGQGMDIWLENAANASRGLHSRTEGLGVAASFEAANSASTAPAVSVWSASTAPAIDITTTSGWTSLNARQEGASGHAGRFDATSSILSLFSTNAGSGGAIGAETTGSSGSAGWFNINNSSNGNSVIHASTNGTGGAAYLEITNAASTPPGMHVNTVGQGGGVRATSTGTGYAGWFEINNSTNSSNALWTSHNGTGNALVVEHTGASGQLAVFSSDGTNVAWIDKTGTGFFNGGTFNTGADVAEMFDVEGEKSEYEPGDVLIISESTDRTVEKSSSANSTKVAGVYATKPGLRLTEETEQAHIEALVPMGVVGVIPTKVCLENGPIKRGDLLVTSSKKGHAMKAIPVNINGVLIYPTGAILGKALENFDGAESGLIKVLVNVK